MKRGAVAERPPAVAEDELFEEFVRPGRPVVLKGAAADWPARDRWTPAFLCATYGESQVDFLDVGTGERKVARLADYFALPDAAARARWYLSDWDFRKRHPELLDDIRTPRPFAIDWMREVPAAQRPDLFWIYIGHAGTRGPTHVDNFGTSAWLAVLQGTKRIRFATPRERGAKALLGADLWGDADLPQVAELDEARLGPGDVVYVPAGRWHAAANETYCLSVTANFVDGACFAQHRRFEMRRWYGRRMLASQLDRLAALPAGLEREHLARHVSLALARLRGDLQEELDEVLAAVAVLEGDRRGSR